jgi:hypothetical protein
MTIAVIAAGVLALVYVARRARTTRNGPIGAFKRSPDSHHPMAMSYDLPGGLGTDPPESGTDYDLDPGADSADAGGGDADRGDGGGGE